MARGVPVDRPHRPWRFAPRRVGFRPHESRLPPQDSEGRSQMKPTTGRGWFVLVLLLSGALSSLRPASAEVLFKADFETGDLGQFGGTSKGTQPGHIEVVTDVVHSGKYAGRFSIHE